MLEVVVGTSGVGVGVSLVVMTLLVVMTSSLVVVVWPGQSGTSGPQSVMVMVLVRVEVRVVVVSSSVAATRAAERATMTAEKRILIGKFGWWFKESKRSAPLWLVVADVWQKGVMPFVSKSEGMYGRHGRRRESECTTTVKEGGKEEKRRRKTTS